MRGANGEHGYFQQLPCRRKLSSLCAGVYDGSRQDCRCIGNCSTWRGLKCNSDRNHHYHQQDFYCFFLLILKAMENIESEELIKQSDAQLDIKTTELTVEQQPATVECDEQDFWLQDKWHLQVVLANLEKVKAMVHEKSGEDSGMSIIYLLQVSYIHGASDAKMCLRKISFAARRPLLASRLTTPPLSPASLTFVLCLARLSVT